jgi:DNA polymerase-3 subunit alpha
VAGEELLDAHRTVLVDDELLVVQGKLQQDRFSGGLRLNVQAIHTLASARARFGRHLLLDVPAGVPPVADVLHTWPARTVETEHGTVHQGLGIRLHLRRRGAEGQVDLGDEARFWPCDEALARWRSLAPGGGARIVYE